MQRALEGLKLLCSAHFAVFFHPGNALGIPHLHGSQIVPRKSAAQQFETIECPLHLETVRLPRWGTALLEDLGNLTANELYDPAGAGDTAAEHILQGLDALAAQCENLIVVSNEVFSGGAD